MATKENAIPQTDVILQLAEWLKDYCGHLSNELVLRKKAVGSAFTRHHVRQWVESTLGFLGDSTRLPCPYCGEPIPLYLDPGLMTDIIISLLSDWSNIKGDSMNLIMGRIIDSSDTHQVAFKDHNKNCSVSNKGYVTLSRLLYSR